MNVVPFPVRRREILEVDADLFLIVATLNALGEPATSAEIIRTLQGAGSVDLSPTQVEAALGAFSYAAPTWWPDGPIFRAVALGGRPAWAFTSAFRLMMRRHGLAPSLRT